jgi:hypothetical protein
MRTSEIDRIAGVFLGKSTTASRRHALPIIPIESLASWATTQAEQLLPVADEHLKSEISSIVSALGGEVAGFYVNNSQRTDWSIRELAQCRTLPTKILIVDPSIQSHETDWKQLTFFVQTRFHPILAGPSQREVWPPLSLSQGDGRARLSRTLAGVLISAVAEAWGVTVDQILMASHFDPEDGRFRQDNRDPVFEWVKEWREYRGTHLLYSEAKLRREGERIELILASEKEGISGPRFGRR